VPITIEEQPTAAQITEPAVAPVRGKKRWMNTARNERGMALGIMAVLMIPVGFLLALFMDAGRLYVIRGEMQLTADAAALAAASGFIDGVTSESIQALAAYYVAANPIGAVPASIESLTLNTEAGALSLVLSHQTGPLFWAPAGITVRIGAKAKAGLVTEENQTGRPIPNGNAYGWWKHDKEGSLMAGKDSGMVRLGS
jgi:Flp pilus assembly protein TadG